MSFLSFYIKMELHGPVEPRVQGGANTKAIRPIMGDMVVCSFCVHSLGRTVPFEQVSRLMSLANAPLDNRTDEEFLEAFAALMN